MLMRELMQKTELPSATLRFYEREGLLDERYIERGDNNYRHYKAEAVERVLMIKYGQSAGFTLAEIKQLMQAWDAGELTTEDERVYLEQKLAALSAQICTLEAMRTTIQAKLAKLPLEAP
ncbi:MAG: MerR family transcriptional regulator [Armatimonadetes bacterium]|nr:MerR family transcriptional regulator [Anaerolineae bacterium]